MKRIIIVTFILTGLLLKGKSDVPVFDIAKIEIDSRIFYLMYQSPGLLKEGDFKYYSFFGDHQPTVEETIKKELSYRNTIPFYKELHRINLKNVPGGIDDTDGTLFILKDKIELTVDSIINRMVILSAENGNFYGFTYSADLSEKDNQWLTTSPIEKLFDFRDYELCNMSLFAVKGTVKENEKQNLFNSIDSMLKERKNNLFNITLHRLYKRKIIMIGFCSC